MLLHTHLDKQVNRYHTYVHTLHARKEQREREKEVSRRVLR